MWAEKGGSVFFKVWIPIKGFQGESWNQGWDPVGCCFPGGLRERGINEGLGAVRRWREFSNWVSPVMDRNSKAKAESSSHSNRELCCFVAAVWPEETILPVNFASDFVLSAWSLIIGSTNFSKSKLIFTLWVLDRFLLFSFYLFI